MTRKEPVEDRDTLGGEQPAVPARFFSQLTMGVFLLFALLLATALPGRWGFPPINIAVATATPEPTPTIALTPTPRPLRVYLPEPTPTATPTPVPVERYVVGNTGGDGVWLRKTPAMADRLIAWRDGTAMEVVGPDQSTEGVVWKNVRDPRGNVGYIPSRYLVLSPQ